MKKFEEGDLKFDFSKANSAMRFDFSGLTKNQPDYHSISQYDMKCVDFIVRHNNKTYFIEVKDPDKPGAIKANPNRSEEVNKYRKNELYPDFVRKYRDSLLCRWAEDCIKPPLIYVVLIALKDLTKQDLTLIHKHLEGKLPVKTPERWQRPIVDGCIAVNLETWNDYLPQFPVTRLSQTAVS